MTAKLNQILSVLKANPQVDIVRADGLDQGVRNSLSLECFEIWAAPAEGLYNLWELNPFLEQLVPGIDPDSTTRFEAHRNRFYFGSLFFWDDAGTDTPDTPTTQGCQVRTGIRLRLYPTRRIAEGILEGKLRDRDEITAWTLISYGQD